MISVIFSHNLIKQMHVSDFNISFSNIKNAISSLVIVNVTIFVDNLDLSLLLFEKRKPRLSLESRQKLPELVKRLEDSLYCDASSKVS